MFFLKKLFKSKNLFLLFSSWFCLATFYAYQYMLRIIPGFSAKEIRANFLVNAEDLATLGSFYFLAYSLIQIPIGIIVDRIGIRRVAITSVIICLIGCYMFTVSYEFKYIQLSRIIIGLGSAPTFICALKLVADHFPPGSRGFLIGSTLFFGAFGVVLSVEFLKKFYTLWGWYYINYFSIILGVLLLILLFLGFRKRKVTIVNSFKRKEKYSDIISVFKDKKILIYALIVSGIHCPSYILADLWGRLYIEYTLFIDNVNDSINTIVLMYIGTAIGAVIMPWCFEKINKINFSIRLSLIIIFILLLTLVVFKDMSLTKYKVLLFIIGFFISLVMVVFTAALKHSTDKNSGLIIGILGFVTSFTAALMQQFIGIILDFQWSGTTYKNGLLRCYDQEFVYIIIILAIYVAICALIALFKLKDKQ